MGRNQIKREVVPRLMDGGRIFIIGGGTSVSKEDLEPLKESNDFVIGVNSAYILGDFVDATFFMDCRWMEWNKKRLKKDYKGMLFSACEACPNGHSGVLKIKRGKAFGIDRHPAKIAPNRNSGGGAINLAYHFGATEIILIGYDMKTKKGKHNFHNLHDHTPPENIYEEVFIPSFSLIARDAQILGIKIWNTSMDSALKDFTKKPLGDFFI